MIKHVSYTSFRFRLLAATIDTIWMYGIIYSALWYITNSDIFNNAKTDLALVFFILEWVLPLIVTMVFWIVKSATPGKMLLKIKIVDADTLLPTTPQKLLVRYFAYAVSAAPLCLGFLWVIWDKRKQGWHDKIANTLVIHEER